MPKPMRLVLTGGGTGGHIVPNIALIQELKNRHPHNLQLLYIGGRRSMEKKMMEKIGVPFKGIFTGKVRRYFSLWNVVDAVKIPIGVVQAFFVLLRFRPDAIFAKGGFVSFPVVVGGWLLRVPVMLHESDVVPGLANRVSAKFARKVCVSFDESKKYFAKKKVVVTGNPVRKELLRGDAGVARKFTDLKGKEPVVLVMGGSSGARFLNDLVWDHLDTFLKEYQVVHIYGAGKGKHIQQKGYASFPFVEEEMKDLYAFADVIVTRSGANTLAEIAVLGKPAILIPLGKKASRGDQIVNAETYAKKHTAHVQHEENFDLHAFWTKLKEFTMEGAGKVNEEELNAAEHIATLLEDL